MNLRVTDYIANANPKLQPIMDYIREVVHEAHLDIEENIKWNAPSFEIKGKIVCSLMAFNNHINFVFVNVEPSFAEYAKMEVFGEKSKMKGYKQVKSLDALPEEDILIRLIRDAIEICN